MAFSENRKSNKCVGCRGPKDPGCVVCWGCFKSGVDGFSVHAGIKLPFKYFPRLKFADGQYEDEADTLNRWLAANGRCPSV